MIGSIVRVGLRILLVLVLVVLLLVPLYAYVPPVSTVMLGRWLTGKPVTRIWKPLDQISPNLVRAVIAAEDARFCSHAGVDWVEVGHALEDADDGDSLRGASTIAMQTAKNLFLWPGRQYIRKGLEVPLAYYLNLMWTKRWLIEVYLNIAEWGPNGEFGAEAGARRAFGKSAKALLPSEAALLAAVLPNPRLRNAARPGPGLLRASHRYRKLAEQAGSPITACLAPGGGR
jgi:monofunctional biosynthetic peptidoglycan transglycosylase